MPSIADILFDATVTSEDAEAKLTTFGAKQLRTECYLRQLRIAKKGIDCNDHNIGYVGLLMRQKRVFTEKQRLGVEDGPSKILGAAGIKRRTRHCMIRLLNVMFSETFAGRVHEIDGKPTRAELDSNQTHASSSFWTYIHDAYLSDQAEFGKLNSTLAMFAKCNPAIIVPHDAAKLRDMWKDVSSRYNTALANSRVSGTQDNDFFSFCSGKVDVLYMQEWLNIKTGVLVTAEGKLPKRAGMQTMDTSSDSESESLRESKRKCTRSRSSPSKDDMVSEILETIRSSNNSTEALEIDCRFTQLVSTLSSLLSLRERIMNVPDGSYTKFDLQEANVDIEHVRGKKKALLKDQSAE
ncbi:hypothetical protein F443_13500 [Phytophthora nicotianae P1569]|uniref:Uncharacterized protein n=1 Tax=Phytophthora nicotianae P1569 TaxID=1317065 RepID=V9ET60_PHYNI|nr:hypothetical protein F443_13500 [Phytophthora nicotianae P1569]